MKLYMPFNKAALIVVIVMFLFLSGCSDSPDLQRVIESSKATISGRFYTENPNELNFPIKIIFAIDTSGSMDLADPENRRLDAVLDLIDEYIAHGNTEFQIFLWNNSVEYSYRQNGLYAFTNVRSDIEGVINNFLNDANPNGGGTEFYGVLGAIEDQIQAECPDESNPQQTDQLSVCAVIFLTDGIPEDNQGSQTDEEYRQAFADRITQIRTDALSSGIGAFYFHTVFLDGIYTDNSPEYQEAVDLLTDMSDAGGGSFFEFENASSINFDIFDFTLTTEYEIRNFFVYNYMALAGIDENGDQNILIDSDGDGLPDFVEANIGTNAGMFDTDIDGLGDYFEYELALVGNNFDPLINDTETTQQCELGTQLTYPDEDGDNLTDCEEYFYLSRADEVDSDGDYLPDDIEMRAGSQVNTVTDNEDTDFDGITDFTEIREHTPIDFNAERLQQDYKYDLNDFDSKLVILNQGTESETIVRDYNFVFSNIDIVETERIVDINHRLFENYSFIAGDNIICAWVSQVPKGLQSFVPVYTRACSVINFYDKNKSIEFRPADFKLVN